MVLNHIKRIVIGSVVGAVGGLAAAYVLVAGLDRLGMPPWAALVVWFVGAAAVWYFSALYEQKNLEKKVEHVMTAAWELGRKEAVEEMRRKG